MSNSVMKTDTLEPNLNLAEVSDNGHNPDKSVETTVNQFDISVLGFTTRTDNGLRRAGVNTIGRLRQFSDDDLLLIKGLSFGALAEIRLKSSPDQLSTLKDLLRQQASHKLNSPESPLTLEQKAKLSAIEGGAQSPVVAQSINGFLQAISDEVLLQMLKLRYGIDDGTARTLDEVVEVMLMGKGKLQRLESKAFKISRFNPYRQFMETAAQPFKHALAGTDGRLTEFQLADALGKTGTFGELNALGATRFVLHFWPEFVNLRGTLWGLRTQSPPRNRRRKLRIVGHRSSPKPA